MEEEIKLEEVMEGPEDRYSLESWAAWILKESGLENVSEGTIGRMTWALNEFQKFVIEIQKDDHVNK